MVPCQPRQLVILSLPFAALVAFFWYKRRKSLSRSDPGGTSAKERPVDKRDSKADTVQSTVIREDKFGENFVDNCFVKKIEVTNSSPSTVEDRVKVKAIDSPPNSVETVDDLVESAAAVTVFSHLVKTAINKEPIESIPVIEGASAICVKEEPEILLTVSKEVENQPDTPDFESNKIFHSTVIEDDKEEDIEPNIKPTQLQAVAEPVQYCVVQDTNIPEATEATSADKVKVDENIVTKHIIRAEKEVVEAESDFEKDLVEKEETIPIEEQSTVENIALKNKLVIELTEEITVLTDNSLEATSPLSDTEVLSDTSTKDLSSNSDTEDRIEDISVDTGLGSQDPSSVVEDSNTNMAQDQKTEETTQSSATGLEQKLASLGLDTQQPAQRLERDSANHSPAEVMLSSPAISTFSDAHSEGSSDSGKGCSDVVTPPSRTPAGGSSVAGDQVPSIYEFVLPQVIVGRLIGRHGAFLHDIRAKTHTNVFIKRHPETSTLKICAIEGTTQDIDAALKMIRQKFPLRRFPDLTLERVSFVKNSLLPISPENLQLNLVEGVNNDVILSSLITAGHFFLQLPMHMSYQSLYRLACIMNSVYNTEESPPLEEPRADMVCVAPAHGGWYRVQILTVDEEAHTSYIKFLDYGGFITIDNAMLRQIRGDFLLLPFQAVECGLANVLPAGGEEWPEEAKQLVQLMTTQQVLQAQVYDYAESGMPLVYLYCTQFCQSTTDPSGYETRVVLLNQELVSQGYAELIDNTSLDDGQTTATESS